MELSANHNNYKEPVSAEEERKRLNELKDIQEAGEFTREEGEQFKRLTEEQESQKGLSNEEKQEYLSLVKRKSRKDNWTPADKKKLKELQIRLNS